MGEKVLKEEKYNYEKWNNYNETNKSQNVKNDNEKYHKEEYKENKVEIIEKDKYLRLFADFDDYKRKTEEEKKTEKDKYLRLLADFDDYKRKTEEEKKTEKDKYLRLLADFDNYKRRTEEEKKNISIFVEQLIFSELIVIVDDFERFLNSETNADKKIVEGVSLILKKINSFLTKYEVKKIEIKDGDEFNDEISESVSTQEVTDKNMENKIIKVYENGYKIKDKVLRFAKVIVGKFKE